MSFSCILMYMGCNTCCFYIYIFWWVRKICIKKKLLHQRDEVKEGNMYKQQRKTRQLMYKKKVNLITAKWIDIYIYIYIYIWSDHSTSCPWDTLKTPWTDSVVDGTLDAWYLQNILQVYWAHHLSFLEATISYVCFCVYYFTYVAPLLIKKKLLPLNVFFWVFFLGGGGEGVVGTG